MHPTRTCLKFIPKKSRRTMCLLNTWREIKVDFLSHCNDTRSRDHISLLAGGLPEQATVRLGIWRVAALEKFDPATFGPSPASLQTSKRWRMYYNVVTI